MPTGRSVFTQFRVFSISTKLQRGNDNTKIVLYFLIILHIAGDFAHCHVELYQHGH